MEKKIIGIRREDKNIWEKRTPLVPEDVEELIKNENMEVIIQPSKGQRAFSDEEYVKKGAKVQEDLSDCSVVFGVKEIPSSKFLNNKVYVFFSHVIKGQPYNMPMLRSLLNKKCSLLDYEKIEDENHRRLIFFGRYAGLAGMVESLHALGQKLQAEGFENPFSMIKQPYQYSDLNEIKNVILDVGKQIKKMGFPSKLSPFICGFSGYGHVSQGAQEILDLLPTREIDPEDIRHGIDFLPNDKHIIYKTVFYEKNMFKPKDPKQNFNLQHYFSNPHMYKSNFDDFIPHLTMLINCIYWTKECPRLVTKDFLKNLASKSKDLKLKVIGDISCDIEGSIEITFKSTTLDQPFFIYNPQKNEMTDNLDDNGIVVMAIENLPCEIPVESSRDFSHVLKPYVSIIAKTDFTKSYDKLALPYELKNALIALNGTLTPPYEYIERFLIDSNE